MGIALVFLTLASILGFGAGVRYDYGGRDGAPFSDGESAGIVSMYVWHGKVLAGIQVRYDYGGGQYLWAPAHGTVNYRAPTTKIDFAYPYEQIIEIRGYQGPNQWTNQGINQLYLITYNSYTRLYKTYGPFGTWPGEYFQSPTGNIVGFAGFTTSTSPDALFRGIGVYYQRPCQRLESNATSSSSTTTTTTTTANGMAPLETRVTGSGEASST